MIKSKFAEHFDYLKPRFCKMIVSRSKINKQGFILKLKLNLAVTNKAYPYHVCPLYFISNNKYTDEYSSNIYLIKVVSNEDRKVIKICKSYSNDETYTVSCLDLISPIEARIGDSLELLIDLIYDNYTLDTEKLHFCQVPFASVTEFNKALNNLKNENQFAGILKNKYWHKIISTYLENETFLEKKTINLYAKCNEEFQYLFTPQFIPVKQCKSIQYDKKIYTKFLCNELGPVKNSRSNFGFKIKVKSLLDRAQNLPLKRLGTTIDKNTVLEVFQRDYVEFVLDNCPEKPTVEPNNLDLS